MVRSTERRPHLRAPAPWSHVTECGKYDPAQGDVLFDGVAGARTNSFPSVDIANGAPTGSDATQHHRAHLVRCQRRTRTRSEPSSPSRPTAAHLEHAVNAAESGDRPDFPVGRHLAGRLRPLPGLHGLPRAYQTDTSNPAAPPRRGAPRKRGGGARTWSTVHRGVTGDARTSSANSLAAEFLGDYTYVAATRTGAIAVWTDAPRCRLPGRRRLPAGDRRRGAGGAARAGERLPGHVRQHRHHERHGHAALGGPGGKGGPTGRRPPTYLACVRRGHRHTAGAHRSTVRGGAGGQGRG